MTTASTLGEYERVHGEVPGAAPAEVLYEVVTGEFNYLALSAYDIASSQWTKVEQNIHACRSRLIEWLIERGMSFGPRWDDDTDAFVVYRDSPGRRAFVADGPTLDHALIAAARTVARAGKGE